MQRRKMALYFDVNYYTITASIENRLLQHTKATQTKQLNMNFHTELVNLLHSSTFYFAVNKVRFFMNNKFTTLIRQ